MYSEHYAQRQKKTVMSSSGQAILKPGYSVSP